MNKLNWNLDEVLKESDFDGLYLELEKEIKTIEEKIQLLKNEMTVDDFGKILIYFEKVDEKYSRLAYYPSLRESVNQKDSKAKLMKAKVENLGLKINEITIKMSQWIKGKGENGLDDLNAKRLFEAVADLKYGLIRTRESAKHTLSESEEKIITYKDVFGMGTVSDLRELMETEMEYELKIGNKTKKIKNQSKLLSLVHHPKEVVRKAAYKALLTKQKENIIKFFLIYQAVVRDWNYEAKLRGYNDAISVRNFNNDIPDDAVEGLLLACSDNKTVFQEYFKWKGKELKKTKLERYDLYAPLKLKSKKYSPVESQELVLGALAKFSDKFYQFGKEIIEEQHIDWLPKPNKRGGAFCATVSPKINPYILLNFDGKERDVSTLAHELGHGIHSIYANNHYPSSQQAGLPLAETASTLAEMILFEEILNTETDPLVKKSMLSEKIADSYATILRQNYFVLFEKKAHEKIPLGLSVSELNKIYLDNLKDQFGNSVSVDPVFQHEWSYISHIFESPFYCYAYNFGELLSFWLYARYKESPTLWKPRIEKILAMGGSQNPTKILKDVRIDIRSRQLWQESFDIIKVWQKELTTL